MSHCHVPVINASIMAEVQIRVGVRIVCSCYSSNEAGCWKGCVVVRAPAGVRDMGISTVAAHWQPLVPVVEGARALACHGHCPAG